MTRMVSLAKIAGLIRVKATANVRLGRNDSCRCGSGLKYKHCCLAKDETAEQQELERSVRRAENIDGVTVNIFRHAIDRVRAYNPIRLRKSR